MYSKRKSHQSLESLGCTTRGTGFFSFDGFAEGTCLVGYVDLLGFKQMIARDPKGELAVPLLESAIQNALRVFRFEKSAKVIEQVEYRIFSDNVCFWMSLEYAPPSIFHGMIQVLSAFQLELLFAGVACRGGVSLGHHYSSSNILYGPALVEAVELERLAHYPRILLHPKIMQDPDLIQVSHFHDALTIFKDSLAFVAYLWPIYFGKKDEAMILIRRHASSVSTALEKNRDDTKIHAKYLWLRDYHNEAVDRLTFGDSTMKIPC